MSPIRRFMDWLLERPAMSTPTDQLADDRLMSIDEIDAEIGRLAAKLPVAGVKRPEFVEVIDAWLDTRNRIQLIGRLNDEHALD